MTFAMFPAGKISRCQELSRNGSFLRIAPAEFRKGLEGKRSPIWSLTFAFVFGRKEGRQECNEPRCQETGFERYLYTSSPCIMVLSATEEPLRKSCCLMRSNLELCKAEAGEGGRIATG